MEVDSLYTMNTPTPVVYTAPSAEGTGESVTTGEQQRTASPVTNGKPVESPLAKNDHSNDEMAKLDRKLTEEFLDKTIERTNKELFSTHREFNYSVHKKTGQFLIKIVDSETKETIREIPPEKTLDAVAKMWELAGIFVDEKK